MAVDPRPLQITLVPGTWAYGIWSRTATRYRPADPPRWFEPGSAFRSRLEKELARQGVPYTIEVHEWDGANSVLRRASEAERLSHKLIAQRDAGTRRVVIAHSHGGNIAAKAAAQMPQDDFALVTLSTPFLQAEQRWEESPKVVLVILFVLVGMLCFGAFQYTSGTTEWRAGLWNYFLGLLLVIPLFALRFWFAKYDDRDLASAMNYGAFTRGPLLVVRGFSDEATATIVLGSIGTGLMNGFLYLLATPLRWMWDRKFFAYLIPFLATAAVAAFIYYATRIFQAISIWNTIAVLLVFLLGPIFVAGTFSSLFGREMFFQCLNLVLTVDSVPDSRCNADVITLPATQLSLEGLRHGIYGHPRTAPLIANWLATGQAKLPEWVTRPRRLGEKDES